MSRDRKTRFNIVNKYDPNFKWRYFDPKIDQRADRNLNYKNEQDISEFNFEKKIEKQPTNFDTYLQISTFLLAIFVIGFMVGNYPY